MKRTYNRITKTAARALASTAINDFGNIGTVWLIAAAIEATMFADISCVVGAVISKPSKPL